MSGYGRGWQYPKATGWRRITQRLQEPATKRDWVIGLTIVVVVMALQQILLGG